MEDEYYREEYSDEDEEEEEEDTEIPDGMFKEDLERIKEWNERVERNTADDLTRGYISGAEADYYLKEAIVDLPAAIKNAQEMEKYLREQELYIQERFESGQLTEFNAEVEMHQLNEKRIKLERRLHLNSVGLDWDDIGDVIDDSLHLVDDGYDPKSRETRKEIIEDLKKIAPKDRQAIIDGLYEDGKIDEKQYSFLCREFLR